MNRSIGNLLCRLCFLDLAKNHDFGLSHFSLTFRFINLNLTVTPNPHLGADIVALTDALPAAGSFFEAQGIEVSGAAICQA